MDLPCPWDKARFPRLLPPRSTETITGPKETGLPLCPPCIRQARTQGSADVNRYRSTILLWWEGKCLPSQSVLSPVP